MTVDFYNRNNIKVDQNTCPLRLFLLNIILFIYVTRSREGKRNTRWTQLIIFITLIIIYANEILLYCLNNKLLSNTNI